jgi:hypothetical protein
MIFRKARNIKSGDFIVIEDMTMGLKVDSIEVLKDTHEVRVYPLSDKKPKPCLVLSLDDYIEIKATPFKYFNE